MDISKLSGERLVTFLFGLLALTIPGAGYLFLANKELFFSLDNTKLLLLSIFYSFPLFIFGVICYLNVKWDKLKTDKDLYFDLIIFSSWFALVCFFFSIPLHIWSRFLNLKVDLYWVVSILAIVSAILMRFVFKLFKISN
jgi:hypothetical protein